MKNKSGFLLAEETLKIVIALIALTFLIYFLISLYFAKTSETALQRSRNILIESDESIKNIIENLKESESRETSVPGIHDAGGFDDWVLYSFVGDLKPNSCLGQNCLCICDDAITSRQIQRCDEKGVCAKVPNLDSNVEIELKDALNFIVIEKINEEIHIRQKN